VAAGYSGTAGGLRRMNAPIDLKQFGLSDEQADAIQKTTEETA